MVYAYIAKDINGKYYRGELSAVDENRAWEELRSTGLYPVKLHKRYGKRRKRPISADQLSSFSGGLSAMLHSGIPLAQAMNLMERKESKTDLRGVYSDIYHMLLRGTDLSLAMEAQGGVFPDLIIGIFWAGEMEGNLASAASKMAVYYEKEDKMHKQIVTAMTYPIFLLVTVIIALLLLFTQILPEFFTLFDSLEALPWSTRVLMIISNGLRHNLPMILAGIVFLPILIFWICSKPMVANVKDRAILHTPVLGKLFCTIMTARFARTFSSLYEAGVPIVMGLELTADVIGNQYIKGKFVKVIEMVQNGVPLSESLSCIEELNGELIRSIYIGEETGKLDSLLEDMADAFDCKAETSSNRLLALMEPIMIIIMAIIIGGIMLSVMIPLYQYYQSIG